MKHVTSYFDDYPNSNECFETNDGFLFHRDHDAATHAKTLENKKVVQHKRPDNAFNDDLARSLTEVLGNIAMPQVTPVIVSQGGEVIKPAKEEFTTTEVANPADPTSTLPVKPTGVELTEAPTAAQTEQVAPKAAKPTIAAEKKAQKATQEKDTKK